MPLKNALTIDVEDYFQVSALAPHFPPEQWDNIPCRVAQNIDRILQLLDAHHTHATFFTLGWIAQRHPQIVRAILAGGHELASHGYAHQRASAQTREVFFEDIDRAKKVLEDLSGVAIQGYRAPSFSFCAHNPWAHETLAKAGYRYSSSIYPVVHDHYGMPEAPRFPFKHESGIIEWPISTVRRLGRNWPAGGGGYFRLLPYALSRSLIARINQHDQEAAIFYLHPWELDPEQPRVAQASAKTRFRHYINLDRTQARLARLLTDFSWGRVDEILKIKSL